MDTSLLPALGYLAVAAAATATKRTLLPAYYLLLLLAGAGARVALDGPSSLWSLLVAFGAAVIVIPASARFVSRTGAMTIIGSVALLPFASLWVLPAALLLTAVVSLILLKRHGVGLDLNELVMAQALPALGYGPEQLMGAKVLPSKPTMENVPSREESLALTGGKGVSLPPYVLGMTVLAALLPLL